MVLDGDERTRGTMVTNGPGAYKIPGFSDIPREFNVSLLKGVPNKRAIYSSKVAPRPLVLLAWKEHICNPIPPPLLLSISFSSAHPLLLPTPPLGYWRAPSVPCFQCVFRHQGCYSSLKVGVSDMMHDVSHDIT